MARKRITGERRAQVLEELWRHQSGTCFWCNNHLDRYAATLDHIVPMAHGGSNHEGNLVVCCASCNQIFESTPARYKIAWLRAVAKPCKPPTDERH